MSLALAGLVLACLAGVWGVLCRDTCGRGRSGGSGRLWAEDLRWFPGEDAAGQGSHRGCSQSLLQVVPGALSVLPPPTCTAPAPAASMSYKARKRKMIERAQKEAQKQRIPAPTQPPADMREIRLSRKSPGVIVDSYVPVPKELLPPIYTRAGITSRWERLKKSIRSTLRCLSRAAARRTTRQVFRLQPERSPLPLPICSVGLVRRHVAWQPIPFAQDAQEKLIRAQIALSRWVEGFVFPTRHQPSTACSRVDAVVSVRNPHRKRRQGDDARAADR